MQIYRSVLGYATMMLVSLSLSSHIHASYGIYVGKNLTMDGSVFLGGYGDEPSSHWLDIVPARNHNPGSTITVGVTETARYPGNLSTIPQVPRTNKYLSMTYSSFAGFPAPLTNGGLNEYQVAARDIWSPSREELRAMTPNPQHGPNYSDLSRIAMERGRTARNAVEIIGNLMDTYGYSTYGGNSHLFADPDEGWIVINFAGGKGLWVAERLGPDDIRVSRPGYIGEIPLNFRESPDYMGSANLITFAVEQGWYDPSSGEPFNVNKVYGDDLMKSEAVLMVEQRLRERAPNITLKDIIEMVRIPDLTRDSAGYGTVAHLRSGIHRELGVIWMAPSTPTTSPFIPWHLGVTDLPPEFSKHRNLTEGEASLFLDSDWLGIESTRYAFSICKRLFYLTVAHQDRFLQGVMDTFEGFEDRLIAKQETIEKTAMILYKSGEPGLARDYLTTVSSIAAMEGIELAETLSQSIEAQTKVIFGIQKPTGEKKEGRVGFK